MAFPKTFRVSELKSTPITNYKSYIQVLKEPITIAEGIIVAFETSMRVSLDTQSKHPHRIGGLFIQKILAKTKQPSEFARYMPYDTIGTSGQHKFINELEGTEEQRDFVAINKTIKKIGNEPLLKAKGRKEVIKKTNELIPKTPLKGPRNRLHQKLVDFVSTKPVTHIHYQQRLDKPIDISIGRVAGFITVLMSASQYNEYIPHQEIVFYYVQKKLARTKKYSECVTRYQWGNILPVDRDIINSQLRASKEYQILLDINQEIKDNTIKNRTHKDTLDKPLAPWTQAPVVPKEIERKFLPAPTEIFNSSWINQVLAGYIKSVDLIQSYVKLESIKFHIAEDTVFLQSLNKTMNTPIVAVEVGNANCVILRELFASTEKKAVRIRKQDHEFFFTIKLDIGKTGECIEIEVSIDLQTYMAIKMYCGREISKMRLSTMHDGLKYEVDIFKNSIFGFTLIELELPSIDHPVNLPAWVGKEVTGDPTYFNSNLLRYNSYKDGVLSV